MTNAFKNNIQFRNNCFEIQGYDIMLTDQLECKLIEINLSPSLHCGSPLDLKIKGTLLKDVFNLIGIVSTETRDQINKYDMNPLRPVNVNLISSLPSGSNLRPGSYKNKKNNWKKIDKIVSNH